MVMPEFEFLTAIRDFVETGGDVLLVIGAVTFVMWILILERWWFFRWIHREDAEALLASWAERVDRSSWSAHQLRRMLISEMEMKLQRSLIVIKALVALCPMLGLLGTVTGMIEVFDVMAISGSGNARGMAGGVSKATLPTMAGMVAALSGLVVSVRLERYSKSEVARVEQSMEISSS
jgi:biopolymer transport protein ExbB